MPPATLRVAVAVHGSSRALSAHHASIRSLFRDAFVFYCYWYHSNSPRAAQVTGLVYY
jgi:hypothetical protein